MLDSHFLNTYLEDGLQHSVFHAAASALGVRDTVLASACVGEAPCPGDLPVDEHTCFDMASLSKVLGPTMIALRCIQDGRLRLDETIGDFFPDAPQDKKDITVQMLMTHTGGFHPSFRLDQMQIKPEDAVRAILDRPLIEQPGKRPIYSCMGYILFARMLESRFGQPLNRLAETEVFRPLGMNETGYCPGPSSRCAATEVDPVSGRPWIGIVHDENARFLRGISGNAGVFMPLCDGIRFSEMLACMGKDYLSEHTLRQAIRNYTPGQEQHRGLGFHLAGTPDCFFSNQVPDACFGHTGFTGTSLLVEPDSGLWVLLLTNRVYPTRDNDRLFPFRRRLHADVWREFQTMHT